MRRGRSLPVLAVIAAVLSLALAAPASAHHGYDSMRPTTNYFEECATDNFCTTDNATLTYFSQGSLSPYSRTQIRSVLENQFAPTDLSVSRQNPPSYEGSAETDIIYGPRSPRPPPSGWSTGGRVFAARQRRSLPALAGALDGITPRAAADRLAAVEPRPDGAALRRLDADERARALGSRSAG